MGTFLNGKIFYMTKESFPNWIASSYDIPSLASSSTNPGWGFIVTSSSRPSSSTSDAWPSYYFYPSSTFSFRDYFNTYYNNCLLTSTHSGHASVARAYPWDLQATGDYHDYLSITDQFWMCGNARTGFKIKGHNIALSKPYVRNFTISSSVAWSNYGISFKPIIHTFYSTGSGVYDRKIWDTDWSNYHLTLPTLGIATLPSNGSPLLCNSYVSAYINVVPLLRTVGSSPSWYNTSFSSDTRYLPYYQHTASSNLDRRYSIEPKAVEYGANSPGIISLDYNAQYGEIEEAIVDYKEECDFYGYDQVTAYINIVNFSYLQITKVADAGNWNRKIQVKNPNKIPVYLYYNSYKVKSSDGYANWYFTSGGTLLGAGATSDEITITDNISGFDDNRIAVAFRVTCGNYDKTYITSCPSDTITSSPTNYNNEKHNW